MTQGIFQVLDLQKVSELIESEQIAGVGATPNYISTQEVKPPEIEPAIFSEVRSSLASSHSAKLMHLLADKLADDSPNYIFNKPLQEFLFLYAGVVNKTQATKLEDGSNKIDGDDPAVQELLDQILEEAGLSERPEGMSEEEYQQAVAEAIANWVNENIEYLEDPDSDYWQSVKETLERLTGDCEDMAILVASLLVAAGIDPDKVAVVVSADGTHAFVAVEINGKVYILDPTAENSFVETSYGSLDALLNDREVCGAWFKQGGYGVNNSGLEINTASNQDSEYDVAAIYTVRVNNITGEVTVIGPDGEEHAFENTEDAQEYLQNKISQYDEGCVIVDYFITTVTQYGPVTVNVSEVYKDGERVASFEASYDSGVLILSAREKAEQWIQNQHYQNADTSYIYEFPSLDGLDENSSQNDFLGALGEEMDNTIENYDPRDFYYYDEDGDMHLDNQRLEDWYRKVRFLCGLLVALEMLIKAKHEGHDVVQEEMLEIVADKGMDTATIIGKYVQNRLARLSVAFAKLLQQAQEWNKELYERRVEAAKAKNDDCWEKTVDVISGGSNTIAMLEGMKAAAEQYLQAMVTVLEALQSISEDYQREQANYGSSDTGQVNEALRRGEMALLVSLPNLALPGENGYLELDDEGLENARKQFYALQSAKKAWNRVNTIKTEIRNLVHQEMTGVGGRERNKNAEKLQELEGMHATQIFETQVSMVQAKIQLHNNIRYLENEIEKARNSRVWNIIANIVALVAIVVSFFIPPLGLALGLLAAGIRLAGAIHAYSISENYKPDFNPHKANERDTDTGNVVVDSINETANWEDELLAKADEKLLEQNDDDFWSVNYKKIADIQKQLTRLQNIRRAILALEKEKANLRKLAHMEMTGIGGLETSDYVSAANEEDFQQAQFKLELLAFMLNEVKTARNIEVANEKALFAAIRSFVISVACSIGGALLGAGLGSLAEGAAEGASQGAAQGLAEGVAEGTGEVVAKGAEVAAKGAEVASKGADAAAAAADVAAKEVATAGTQVATQVGITTAERGFYIGWSVGGTLGGFIAGILNQTIWGSYGVSYGDSRLPAYLLAIRKNNPNSPEARLEALEAEIYEDLLINGIDRNVGEGYWGLRGEHIAKLRSALGRIANVKNALASLYAVKADARNLVHMEMTGISGPKAGELAQAVNRAEFEGAIKTFDYLTQYLGQRIEVQQRHVNAKKAMTDAAIKLGIDAVMIAACVYVGTPASIGAMPAILALANSTYDFLANLIRSESKMGRLENYEAAQVAKEIKNSNDPNATVNRLDQMESQVYAEISQELIEELGAGRWGVSSGALALLRHKMEKIYNIRDVLARLQASEAEARAALHAAMTGIGGRMSAAGAAFTVDRAVALSNLVSLFRNIQTMVERHNQMNAATRAMWQSLVGMAFAALNVWIAVKSANLDYKFMNEAKQLKEGYKKLDGLQKDYQAVLTGKEVPGQTKEGLEKQISATRTENTRLEDKYKEAREVAKQWALYEYMGTLSESMAVFLTGIIYDSAKGSRESNKENYSTQVSALSSSNREGWAAAVETSENAAVHSAIGSGNTELDTQALEISVQQNEELLDSLWTSTKASVNYLKSLREPNPAQAMKPKKNDGKTGIPAEVARAVQGLEQSVSAKGEEFTRASNDYLGSLKLKMPRFSVPSRASSPKLSPDLRLTPQVDPRELEIMERELKLKKALGALDSYVDAMDELSTVTGALQPGPLAVSSDRPASFVGEDKHIVSAKALLERLDQIERGLQKKLEQIQSNIRQVDSCGDEAIQKSQKALNLAVEGKTATKDLQKLLDQARQFLKQAQEQFNTAVKSYNAAIQEAKAVRAEVAKALAEVDSAIETLESAIAGLKRQADEDPSLAARIKSLEDQVVLLKLRREALTQKEAELQDQVSAAKGKVDQARAKVQEAAREVNRLVAKIEREGREESPQSTNEQGTLMENAVARIDKDGRGGAKRNPYEEYVAALEEQKVAEESLSFTRSKVSIAA